MNPNSLPEIKKHVGGTAKYAADLILAEGHDGAMWASNRYWLAPAERVAPLLAHYNLPTDKPGAYKVNGTVQRNEGGPVPPVKQWLNPARYTSPLTRVSLAGLPAMVRTDDRSPLLAVYQAPDGAYLGMPPEDLDWLSTLYTLAVPEGCYYGMVRYCALPPGDEKNRSVAIIADLIRRTPVWHGTGENGEPTTRGGATENLGPCVLGMIATTKLGTS